MKYLGIDFGTKRVGLAVSDPGESMAFPLRTVVRTTRDKLFAELLQVIEEEKIEGVVIGLPLGLDGMDTLTTRQVRNFAARLGRRTTLPLYYKNEELSSFDAEQELRESGLSGKKLKEALDRHAAARILQSFLNSGHDGPAGE